MRDPEEIDGLSGWGFGFWAFEVEGFEGFWAWGPLGCSGSSPFKEGEALKAHGASCS